MDSASSVVLPELRERVLREGRVRVIAEMRLPSGPHVPEGLLSAPALGVQRNDIASVRGQILTRLAGRTHRVLRQYGTAPLVALDVGPDALAELEASSLWVRRVVEDAINAPTLAQSVPLIGADQAWSRGYDGTGMVVAIVDTGVEATHPFLAGKVVEEACYSSTFTGQSVTVCPNGQSQQIGPGAGVSCPLSSCWHGTHVAGIAAGNGGGAAVAFSGVAKGAQLMAVQVFSKFTRASDCGGSAPCVLAWTSDIIAGLERVYAVRGTRNLASANLSLGGGLYTAPCDGDPTKPIIDNLRSAGIATAIAAGNNSSTNSVSAPGCISSAISVGATTKSDVIASYSNMASFVSLNAPGSSINSSVVGGGFGVASGTSMATPHVAGTWAVLKQAAPGASVNQILSALQTTGVPILDTRNGGTITKPRIRVDQALAALVPAVGSITPNQGAAGSAVPVTINGGGFLAGSTVSVGGTGVTVSNVTLVSATQLTATLTIAAGATAGARDLSVTNPNGGTATLTGGFSVTGTLVTVSSVTPNQGLQGAAVPVTITGAGFAAGASVSLSGTGVSVSNVSVGSATQLTATLTIAAGASPGARDITVTNSAGGGGTLTGGFTIAAPVTVGSITPNQGVAGATMSVTIGGSGFAAGATVSLGAGISVSNLNVASATQITAMLTIASGAAPGTRSVTVTNTGGASGTLTGAFTVASAAPASLTLAFNGFLRDRVGQGNTALAPDGALDGTLTATLTAPGGRTVTALRLDSNAPGIWDTVSGNVYWVLAVAPTLDGTLLNAPSTMAVNFPVADGGSFVVFAADYQNSEFLPGRTLTLTATFSDGSTAIATTTVGGGAVTVGSVSPNQGPQGGVVPVTIAGSGFATGATVSLSGTGVAVSNVSVGSATQITATLTIAAGTAPGARNITVTNSSGAGATLSGAFTVTTAVSVGSVSPNQGVQGAAVPVTITGSGFASGAAVSLSGTGIAVSNVSVGSATQLTATFTIAAGATLGARDVTVTNTGGAGATLTSGFTVASAAPASLTLAFNGFLRDRVGQGNTALAPDGALDGTLTATLSASGGRTVTALRLDSNAPGIWDTASGNVYWVLAVAPTLDGTLLNAPGTMAVNFSVADGGSFVVFASDYQNSEFLPGRTLTITATFSDGSTAIATTTVAGAAMSVGSVSPNQGTQGTAVPVTITGAGFATGTTLSLSGTGVAVSNTSVVSATQLTATLTVAAGATLGARDVTVTNSGGAGATLTGGFTVTSASSATLALVYNGLLRDRVGKGDAALSPDGALDGTLTATLTASGGRTVTALRLDSTGPGTWDTSGGNVWWVLAVAPTLDGALLNAPGTMAVNFPVANGGSFVLFASDYQDMEFLPGRTLTLTASFSDGSTATATTTVP